MKKTSIITAKILVILFLFVFNNVKAQWTCADVNLMIDNSQTNPFPDSYLNFDLLSADFDGDGLKDLCGENYLGGVIGPIIFQNTSVLNGAISFNPSYFSVYAHSTSFAFPNNPGLTVADFNDDGKPDIAEQVFDTMYVFMNNSTTGSFLFSLPTKFQISYPINFSFLTGFSYVIQQLMKEDINQDGKPDLELDDANGHASVFLNTTTSGSSVFTFSSPTIFTYPVLFHYGSAFSDVTNDGLPDFMIQSNDTLYSFLNTTIGSTVSFSYSGNFELLTADNNATNSDESLNMDFADADLDGKTDLLLHINNSISGDSVFVCILHNNSTSSQIIWNYNYRIGIQGSTPYIMFAQFARVCGAVPDVVVSHDGIQSGGIQALKYFKNTSTAGVISFNLIPCVILDVESDMLCQDDFNNDTKNDFCSWWDLHEITNIRNLSLFASAQTGGLSLFPVQTDSGCSKKISFNFNSQCYNDTLHFVWNPAIAGDTGVAYINLINDSVSVHVFNSDLTYDSVFNFVYIPSVITVTPVVTNGICQKIITINHISPCTNSPFHFVWSPVIAGDTNVAVLNVFINSVSVHVYNDDLTFDTIYSFTLTLPTVTVTPSSQTICAGDVVVFHASGDSQYTWTPSNGLSASTGSSPTASPSVSTTYTVHGTCLDSAVVHITVHPLPAVTAGPDTAICLYENVQLFATGGVTYVWNPTNGLSSSTGNSPMADPLINTTYTVIATDVNGCTNSAVVSVGVTVIPQVYAGHDTTILINSSHYIYDATTNGTGFIWSPDLWIDNTGNLNPTVTPLETSVYILTAVNGNGCTASDSVTIFIDPNLYLLFPSAFSPNGDGANDFFRPVFFNVSDYNLKIYNRWGQLIFESNDPKLGWDGKFNGEYQEVGVYIFIAEAKGFLPGSNKIIDGNITLLR